MKTLNTQDINVSTVNDFLYYFFRDIPNKNYKGVEPAF